MKKKPFFYASFIYLFLFFIVALLRKNKKDALQRI